PRGGCEGVGVDRFLAGDGVGVLQQFEPVGADGHRSFSFVLSLAAVIERRGLDMLQSSFGRRAREDGGWGMACSLLSCILRLPTPCLALRRLAAPERFG